MSRLPRTYPLRAWLCDRIAPPGYRHDSHHWFDELLTQSLANLEASKRRKSDDPPRIIPPETYEWISPPADMPPAPTTEQVLRKLGAGDTPVPQQLVKSDAELVDEMLRSTRPVPAKRFRRNTENL